MSAALLPQPFWFRVAATAPRVAGMPLEGASGPLPDLPPASLLPSLAPLDGREPWARVRVGWNPAGLGISVEAEGTGINPRSIVRPEGFASISFWIDTRDTRTIARATRYCHHVHAKLIPSRDGKRLTAEVRQLPIARATAEAPIADPSRYLHRAESSKKSWRFDLFIPAEALHGFDPDVNRRLGFAHHVADFEREDQFLGIGREFPLGENPGLWSTLVLGG